MFVPWSTRFTLFVFSRGEICNKKYCDELSTVYNVCVLVFLCLCMWRADLTSKHLIQYFLIFFSPSSTFSVLSHWSVSLPSFHHTSPQVAIMSGMILMSWLLALLLTDKGEKKPVSGPGEAVSPLSQLLFPLPLLLSSSLSAGRRFEGLALWHHSSQLASRWLGFQHHGLD